MGFVLVARHGPTFKDELDRDKYINEYVSQIKEILDKYGPITKIYSSPIDRCKQTAKILAKEIGVKSVHIKNELLRFDPERECTCVTRKKAIMFGYNQRNSDENILIVTHSSVLRHVLEGLRLKSIDRFYVNKGSITVFDKEEKEFVLFNTNCRVGQE
ncbi:histidine phosphatase family protein [Yasminevirus sp. GU-2018]|uniref:Histidine phosphatase family protein n=1 Tax=Yasminevirus sp. GU-2018 TaxID=2420051 RepID=A0A5K0UA60_9VIRU|nr:histidine phosphatase family protein [Yasminevirus sp. GU-2018]